MIWLRDPDRRWLLSVIGMILGVILLAAVAMGYGAYYSHQRLEALQTEQSESAPPP